MARHVLYIYIGAQRMQAAWAPRRGAELRMLFDTVHAVPADDGLPAPADAGALPAGFSHAMEALGRHCQAEPALVRGAELRVLLSDQWVPSASVPWGEAQYRASAAIAAARAELRDAGHEVTQQDLLRLDDAPLRQPRLAVCYPAALLEPLARLAAALKTRPYAITTLSALAWRGNDASAQISAQTHAQPERVLAILEPGDATARQVILVRGQRASACIDEVVIRPLHADSGARPATRELSACVAAIVQRLGWNAVPSAASPEVATLFSMTDLTPNDPLTGAAGPMAWWVAPQGRRDLVSAHALDAVARAARPSALKLLVLACVVAGIGFVSLMLWRNDARLQETLAKASAAQHAAVVQQAPPPSAEQAKRIAAVNAVISELNIPLPRLLRAMQAPKDIRVGLLGLELVAGRERGTGSGSGPEGSRPSRPTLKIHAEAPNSVDMTRYVAYLSDRKPLERAYLVRHEVPENVGAASAPTGEGRATYRFTVEVAWKD